MEISPVTRNKKHLESGVFCFCAPTGIRTPVVALKGPRPSPLDDGGMDFIKRADFITLPCDGQAFELLFLFGALVEHGEHVNLLAVEQDAR